MGITIVGLGPGDVQFITRQAWDILSSAEKVYLRTERHPLVEDLPGDTTFHGFDHYYETAESFDQVYSQIVAEVMRLGREARDSGTSIIYAVPGHPLIGETTVTSLISSAKSEGLQVAIVPGLSFIEPVLDLVGVDALDGLQLFDAIEVAQFYHPPLNSDVPLLLGQVYDRFMASDLKLALMAVYPDTHEVILIHEAGLSSQEIERVSLYAIDRSERLSHLTSLFVPPLPFASSLPALAETVAYLRGPDGCPWDQEQTHQSLRDGFLEEAAEVLEALDNQDPNALCEELGDMLYHLVMQAQLASEDEEFNLSDVVAGIESKLKRRHPHVWGDWEAEDTEEVVRNWEWLKSQEKMEESNSASLLDNIPYSLPALARAQKIQKRVERVGFDWPAIEGVVDKVDEEMNELKSAISPDRQLEELGDVLFAVVNWARWLGINAEIALREANIRFDSRFRIMEQMAKIQESELAQLDLQSLELLWEKAKIDKGTTQM